MSIMILDKHPTGSRYICDPPVSDTDEDTIVLVASLERAIEEAQESEWTSDTSYPGDDFISLRNGHRNFIVTEKKEFYDKFVFATNLAKKLNLLKKEDRVTLFQALLYKNL